MEDTVYHVGDLERPRDKPIDSYEGDALSVTTEPYIETWTYIAKLSGALHRLRKQGARWFHVYDEGNEQIAIDWSIREGYLSVVPKWRVYWNDEDDVRYAEYIRYEDAKEEADWHQDEEDFIELREVSSYALGPRGQFYVTVRLGGDPTRYAEAFPEHFAPLWYAEAHDYDGVWWDEEENLGALSAPRGAIFQSVLPTWEIEIAGRDF